jgi:hypothetical protein
MQTAQSDDWRPGFAKRADNFDEVCAKAEAWRWRPGESIARVAAAVLKGTPGLTTPQRMTLLLYVEHLNQDRLEQDIACVWPSTGLVADYLGCSESQARTNRRALEAAGYMVRDYNRANRPAGLEAYDLRPLMARLDELEAVDAAIREASAARRAIYSEAVAFPAKYSARAPESRRLEQSHENLDFSVPEKDAAQPRHHPEARPSTRPADGNVHQSSNSPQRTGRANAIGSPGGASGLAGAKPAASVYAEMVRQELQAAVQVCPRLRPLLPDHVLANPASATPADAARIAAAAPSLLPEPERNNGLSMQWGWARHGIRAVAMLAIALEDPKVRNPCSYFGWMATRSPDGAPDLRLNLARILREKGVIPPIEAAPAPEAAAVVDVGPPAPPIAEAVDEPLPLMFAPGVEDRRWHAIDGELRRLVREGAYGSWFGRIGFQGVTDGVLNLSTPNGTSADRIKRDYIPAILMAAEAAEVFVDRVVITVRKR